MELLGRDLIGNRNIGSKFRVIDGFFECNFYLLLYMDSNIVISVLEDVSIW